MSDVRSEEALRRAITQAEVAEMKAVSETDYAVMRAFAQGAGAALRWAVGDTSIDAFGGAGIHELGDRSFYHPAAPR